MNKRCASLSEAQLISYRPEKRKKEAISFAERLALLPSSTPRSAIEAALKEVLRGSKCELDGVAYVAANLEIGVDQMRVPEYLLLHSLIQEYGGGLNGERIVLGVEPPSAPVVKPPRSIPPRKSWAVFGREPENIGKKRVGRGVGGGMTKVYIWDIKTRIMIKEGAEQWSTETTLAFSGTT